MIRGIAALSVLLHHVLEESGRIVRAPNAVTWLGAAGVDVFFVLSGFLMLYANLKNFDRPFASAIFLQRRIIRIVPLYWLCALVILSAHITGRFYQHLIVTPGSVLRSLLFIENSHPLVYVAWTLSYEMYFYVIFAACLFSLRSPRLALPFVSLFIILNVFFFGRLLPGGSGSFLANPISLEFLMGMAIASCHWKFRLSAPASAFLSAIAVAWMYLASAFSGSAETAGVIMSTRYLTWGLPASLLVFSALFWTKPKFMVGRLLLLLGESSYSLYLTHAMVMTAYASVLKRGWTTAEVSAMIPVCVVFCLALAILVHRRVERPVQSLLKRVWEDRGQRPTSPKQAVPVLDLVR